MLDHNLKSSHLPAQYFGLSSHQVIDILYANLQQLHTKDLLDV